MFFLPRSEVGQGNGSGSLPLVAMLRYTVRVNQEPIHGSISIQLGGQGDVAEPKLYALHCSTLQLVCRMGKIISLQGMMRRGLFRAKPWDVYVVCGNPEVAARLEEQIWDEAHLTLKLGDGVEGLLAKDGQSVEAVGMGAESVVTLLALQGVDAVWIEETAGRQLFLCRDKA